MWNLPMVGLVRSWQLIFFIVGLPGIALVLLLYTIREPKRQRASASLPEAPENVKVLGDAPALAVANLYVATSQALANAAHNATTAQQQTKISRTAPMWQVLA